MVRTFMLPDFSYSVALVKRLVPHHRHWRGLGPILHLNWRHNFDCRCCVACPGGCGRLGICQAVWSGITRRGHLIAPPRLMCWPAPLSLAVSSPPLPVPIHTGSRTYPCQCRSCGCGPPCTWWTSQLRPARAGVLVKCFFLCFFASSSVSVIGRGVLGLS